MLGADGLLAGAAPGTVIAIHSTILPRTVREIGAAASARGVAVVDACVTGGPMGAEQGRLTYMVGGEAADLERCRPVFATAARTIVHTGALGTGAATKLCNNLMTYLGFLAAFEATTLARAAGLSTEAFEEVTRSNGNLTDQMQAFLMLHRLPAEVAPDVAVDRHHAAEALGDDVIDRAAQVDHAVDRVDAHRRQPAGRRLVAVGPPRVGRQRQRVGERHRRLDVEDRPQLAGVDPLASFGDVMQFTPTCRATSSSTPPSSTSSGRLVAPGSRVRERRLVTLTVLMGMGNEMTLRLHFGAAMKSGDLSDTEIDELDLHVAHYGGWPQAAIASQVVRQLRAERT